MITQVTLSKVLKGLYSAAVSVLGSLAAILSGDANLGDLTSGQWITVGLAGLVAFGGTFGLAGWAGPPPTGIVKAEGQPDA